MIVLVPEAAVVTAGTSWLPLKVMPPPAPDGDIPAHPAASSATTPAAPLRTYVIICRAPSIVASPYAEVIENTLGQQGDNPRTAWTVPERPARERRAVPVMV
jgi:hypothetical protein